MGGKDSRVIGGIDLGATKILSLIVDEGGKVLAEDLRPTEGDAGTKVVIGHMVASLRQALVNAGPVALAAIGVDAGQDGSVMVQNVKEMKKGEGYDAAKDEYGNMEKKGIIDPLKVTRAALENAISIAGMVLTTNCLVTDIPEKKEMPAMPQAPMY